MMVIKYISEANGNQLCLKYYTCTKILIKSLLERRYIISEGGKQLVMLGISKLAHNKHFDCSFQFLFTCPKSFDQQNIICVQCQENPNKAFHRLIGISKGLDRKFKEKRLNLRLLRGS